MKKRTAQLSMWGFFAITVVMVMDLPEYAVFASSGFSLVFFLIAGGLFWFLPAALCAAEMATIQGWEEGGIFTWVTQTLGKRLGFAAAFFQWFQVTVGFVVMLYFVLSAFTSFLGVGFFDTNPFAKFLGIMIIYWLLTLVQLGGVKNTELIGRLCLIVGIVIPTVVLLFLFFCYLSSGNPLRVEISPTSFFPDFTQFNTLVVFVAFILSYAGIEASAPFANDLKNPRREYPLVLILVVLTAIIVNTISGLSIAAVVPLEELSMSAGIVQALQSLFSQFSSSFSWLAQVVALCIAMGTIGEIAGWILGPARALYTAAQKGILPSSLAQTNKKGVPIRLVILQGVVVTFWAALLTFAGGGDNLAYLVAISLTVVIYLFAYLLLFGGYFVLTFKMKNVSRAYHVPGGTLGKSIIAGCGLIVSLLSLGISFVPPALIADSAIGIYETILIVGALVVAILPFILYALRNKVTQDTRVGYVSAEKIPRFVHPRIPDRALLLLQKEKSAHKKKGNLQS